ncbi:MAG: hypothetical protein HZB13_00915, partial [Acidobacteria bacterium]|nr:hypothetical protein [Acidobacteriota bacterium]
PFEEGYKFGLYRPTLTELLISLASLAGFLLLLALFTRFFPIMSIWECCEAQDQARARQLASALTHFPQGGEWVRTNE